MPSASRGSDPHKGLDSNPGTTAQLFSQSHPYFPDSCAACPFGSGLKNRLSYLFTNRKPDCVSCKNIDKHLPAKRGKKKAKRKEQYKQLKADPNYVDVRYNKKTGALYAAHVGHNSDTGKKEFFNGTLSGGDLEKACVRQLFRQGHSVILMDESKELKRGERAPAVDLELDGVKMDIRSVTGNGWYSLMLRAKNKQLAKYNARPDVEQEADAVCLYFHKKESFDRRNMAKSIPYFKEFIEKEGLRLYIKHVYVVINGENGIIKYDL